MANTTFNVPEGFEAPEGNAPGDTFEVLATVEWGEDGTTMTVTAVDGIPISGGEPAEDADAAPAEDASFLDAVSAGMQQPPM